MAAHRVWQYPGRPFKIAAISRWVVVLNGPQLVDEVRRAPADILSFDLAIQEVILSATSNFWIVLRSFY